MHAHYTVSLFCKLREVRCELSRLNARGAKLIFRETLESIPADTPSRAIESVIAHMAFRLSTNYVLKEINRLPDSRLRNSLLRALIDVDTCHGQAFASFSGHRAAKDLIFSEFVTVDALNNLLSTCCDWSNLIAERALLMMLDEPVGLADLLHRLLIFHKKQLKPVIRERIIAALIGMDTSHSAYLMTIIRQYPEHRRAAAAVALHRGGLTKTDLALLISYPSIRDIVDVAL